VSSFSTLWARPHKQNSRYDHVLSAIPLSLRVYPALVFDTNTVVHTFFLRSFFFLHHNTNTKHTLTNRLLRSFLTSYVTHIKAHPYHPSKPLLLYPLPSSKSSFHHYLILLPPPISITYHLLPHPPLASSTSCLIHLLPHPPLASSTSYLIHLLPQSLTSSKYPTTYTNDFLHLLYSNNNNSGYNLHLTDTRYGCPSSTFYHLHVTNSVAVRAPDSQESFCDVLWSLLLTILIVSASSTTYRNLSLTHHHTLWTLAEDCDRSQTWLKTHRSRLALRRWIAADGAQEVGCALDP